MIITQVLFRLGNPISLEAATAIFESTAPKYKGRAGLQRKYYIRSEDGLNVGGLYFWNSRADADATYTEDWKKIVTEKYGTPPIMSYFDAPVFVDNT